MNIIEIRVQAVNDTAAGLEAARGSAEEVGAEAGDAFAAAFADVLSTRLGQAAGAAGAEAAAMLTESVTGAGDAMAADIGSSLSSGLSDVSSRLGPEGQAAGAAYGEGLAEGTAGIGDTVGHGLAAELTSQVGAAGAKAGETGAEQLAGALSAGTSSLGDQLAAHISEQLRRGLDEHAQTTMGVLGAAMAAGTAGISVAVGSSLAHVLSIAGMAAGAEAGSAAGVALGAAVGDGAATTVGAGAAAVASAMEAPLADALTQAGGAAGDGLLAGIAQGAEQGADQAAQKVADSLQTPLEASMTTAGAVAGDAFNVGFASTAGEGGEGGSGGVHYLDFGAAEHEVEQQAAQLGQTAARTFRINAAGTYSAGGQLIPYGGMEPDELLAMGQKKQEPDPFVPSFTKGENAWTLASKVGAQDAAKAAWQAYGEELAGLVITPGQFERLTDAGVQAWTEEVAAQAAVSGEGFVHAFADAMTMGMAGIDWGSLSGAQASALGNAMRGTLVSAVAAAEPEVTAEAEYVGVKFVESVTGALAEVPAVAAEEGGTAGAMFAKAFSAASSAVGSAAKAVAADFQAGFQAEFTEDPKWQKAMGKASALGDDVKAAAAAVGQSVSAVGQNVSEQFAQNPQWQALMAESREVTDAIAANFKTAYGAVTDFGAGALARAKDVFGAIGDFSASVAVRGKEAISAIGDLGPAVVDRAKTAFDALSAYGAEFGDTISGKIAHALTDSVTNFAGSMSILGEVASSVFAKSGTEAGAAFDASLAEGLAQSSPEAIAAVQEMQAQVGAALAAGDDELAGSLIARLDEIQLAASQALDLAPAAQTAVAALDGAGEEIVAVFQSIYERSALMSDGLVTAMVNAMFEIEADTSSFTAQETALWTEFTTVMEEKGVQAAYAVASSMNSLQGKDLLSMGVSGSGAPFKAAAGDAEGLASGLGDVEKATAGASAGFGGMSSMMMGPWGMAIFAAMSVLPMLGGALGALGKAFDPAQAVLLDTQNLATAITNDGNVAGAATAAFVAQSAATDGLAASAKAAGVSLTTWTEAVMGNKDAQDQVGAAVEALNQKQLNQAVVTDENTKQTGKFSGELHDAQGTVLAQSDATNKLTDANQKLLSSMQAQSGQIVSAIKNQTDLAQATAALDMNSQILGATLTGLYAKMQLSAQQSAISSVANLNLGTSQMGLNTQLVNAEQAYTEAQTGASAYQTVLTALNGTTLSAAQAQNTLAGLMVTAKTTFDQNKDSLNLNAQAGVTDREALVSASQAITAMAVAQYQSTGDINKANQTIQTQIDNYVKATGATGKAKTAIDQYLESITKIPPNVSTTVTANIAPAQYGLSRLLSQIDTSSGAVTVYENSSGQVGSTQTGVKAQAVGGPSVHYAAVGGSQYGSTIMNEQGPEAVNLPNGSMVVPAANTAALMSGAFAPTGAPIPIELEIVGGEPELVALMRKIVRARGGGGPNSVQRAFGQVTAR